MPIREPKNTKYTLLIVREHHWHKVQRSTAIWTRLSIFICGLRSSKNESSISLERLEKPISKLRSNQGVYTMIKDRSRRINLVDRDDSAILPTAPQLPPSLDMANRSAHESQPTVKRIITPHRGISLINFLVWPRRLLAIAHEQKLGLKAWSDMTSG